MDLKIIEPNKIIKSPALIEFEKKESIRKNKQNKSKDEYDLKAIKRAELNRAKKRERNLQIVKSGGLKGV